MSLAIVWGAGSAVQAAIIGPELNADLQFLEPDEEVAVIVTLSDQVDLKKIKDKYKEKDKHRTEIIKALKDKKVDSLFLRNQPYRISEPEELETRIGEFVESILSIEG